VVPGGLRPDWLKSFNKRHVDILCRPGFGVAWAGLRSYNNIMYSNMGLDRLPPPAENNAGGSGFTSDQT
jgi:hypothetical protein